MLQAIYQIGRNTFRESLRQPIYIILLIAGTSLIGICPAFAWFVFRAQEKLVVDGALSTILVMGWVTAVLCASHTISREINAGTVMLILSKPVSRASFIIAKILGILAALTLFVWVQSIAAMLALRMATDQFRFDPYLLGAVFVAIAYSCIYGGVRNYYGGGTSVLTCAAISFALLLIGPLVLVFLLVWIVVLGKKWSSRHAPGFSFAETCAKAMAVLFTILLIGGFFLPEWSSDNHKWHEGFGMYDQRLVRELVLIMFSVWAMATLATALSTRLNLMSNLTVCAVIFVLGLTSNYIYQQLLALKLASLEQAMHSWFYALIPILLICWVMAGKHFHSRKNTKVRVVEVHGSFALMLSMLIGKAVYNNYYQVQLENPSQWMGQIARVLFVFKNLAARALYAIIPNWQNFWLADVVTKKGAKPIPFEYIGLSGLYILLFVAMFTILAVILFNDREVGAQNVV